MALSDYEKQVLEELEAEFASDTTIQGASTQRAAKEFAGHTGSATHTPRSAARKLSPQRIATGLLASIVGLVGLLGAVSLGYSKLSIALGIASFVIVVGGIYYALHAVDVKQANTTQAQASKRSRRLRAWNMREFMDEQARRWDERER